MRLPSKARLGVFVIAGGLLLGASRSPTQLQNWELGGAQVQLSHLMMLAERLSKQNLLYQLQLGEVRKEDIVETAGQIDVAVRVMYEGSAMLGVPEPPTPELRAQIDRVDKQWGQLRPMAVASPYDYARHSGTVRGDRTADPLLIRHFDDLVTKMIEQALRTQELFDEICVSNGLADCEAMRAGPATTILSERMLKEAIFIYAKVDVERNRANLAKTRALLAKSVEHKNEPIVLQARSPERGTAGRVVGEIRRDIDQHWETLAAQIDRLLAGEDDRFDLMRALATQRELVSEYQRYTIAIVRFGAEQRARRSAAANN